MTTTLTDNDRETIRWFAEECLGWAKCFPCPDEPTHWDDGREGNILYEDDFTGWPGFGRVVEYGLAQGWTVSITARYDEHMMVLVRDHVRSTMATHTDPAIAAMLALRQAVGDA